MSNDNQFRKTYLKVSASQLLSNYNVLQSLSGSFFCPMIKANAYGHGDQKVLEILSEVGGGQFGVSSVEEGIRAKEAQSLFDILVFGFEGDEAVNAMARHQLIPVVSNFAQLVSLSKIPMTDIAEGRSLKFHLKLNTGMNRLGFCQQDIPNLISQVQKLLSWKLVGICTHFFSGENLGLEQSSDEQLKKFENMLKQFAGFSGVSHCHNSASLVASLERSLDLGHGLRPGLLLYGVTPSGFSRNSPLVRPVLSFHSNIVSVQHVKSGGAVSYGGTWTAPRDSLIGIVPAGYADGIRRQISNKGFVLIEGKRLPIVGHVCMDYTMVDLTSLELSADTCVGKEVVFFGTQGSSSISIEEFSGWADCTSWEVLTGLSERVPRIYEGKKWESL